jgi:hypothetical protein
MGGFGRASTFRSARGKVDESGFTRIASFTHIGQPNHKYGRIASFQHTPRNEAKGQYTINFRNLKKENTSRSTKT